MWPIFNISKEDEGRGLLNQVYIVVGYVSALLVVFSLMHFSRSALEVERLIITMAFLGLAILYWLSCFISNKDSQLRMNFKSISLDNFTPLIIVSMVLVGLIEPLQQPVVPYSEISFPSIVRGFFTAMVSVILPGLLLLSIVAPNLHPLLRFILGVHLSLAIISLMTFGLHNAGANTELMFPLTVILITGLWLFRLFKRYTLDKRGLSGSETLHALLKLFRDRDLTISRIRSWSEEIKDAIRSLESGPSNKIKDKSASIRQVSHEIRNTTPFQITVNKWTISLGLMLVSSITIGFLFHTSQVFMIPGDAWRALQPGVDLIAGRDATEEALDSLEYPITYGFMMAGISQITGIPIVNANMFLFPLIVLNLLSIYALVRYVFGMGQGIATTASFFYAFAGGFGWLMTQVLSLQGDFWTLSYLTQDMLFSNYLLANIQFWHRTAALTFGLAAIITFYLATSRSDRGRWVFLPMASLFMVFSYFVHMLPVIFVLPVILYLWYTRGGHSRSDLAVFVISTVAIFAISDALLNGYYSTLSIIKINEVLVPALNLADIPIEGLVIGLTVIVGMGIGLFLMLSRKMSRLKNIRRLTNNDVQQQNTAAVHDNSLPAPKFSFSFLGIIGSAMLVAYFYGIYVWSTFPPNPGLLYAINQLPWYFIPIRFGLIGLLAVVALFFMKRKDSWIGLVSIWFAAVFALANIWWGSKLLGFLFPILAFLAAFSLHSLREKMPLLANYYKVNNRFIRAAKFSSVIVLGFLMILSTSSYVHTLSQYGTSNPARFEPVMSVVSWIYQNVPAGEKVVVYSDDYALQVGVRSFGAHDTILSRNLNEFSQTEDSSELANLGIRHFVGRDTQLPNMIRGDSFPVFKSGNMMVSEIQPSFEINEARITGFGSGTTSVTQESGYLSFNRAWQITWNERLGMVLDLEQSIPEGSRFSAEISLTQFVWDSPSSVQEIFIIFSNNESQVQTGNLLNELGREGSMHFNSVLHIEVERIELAIRNGGTNNASLSVSDMRYVTPEGETARIRGT